MRYAKILGVGAALPKNHVSNDDLAARGVDTNDEWIVQRTGIQKRYLAGEGETTGSLAIAAAKNVLEQTGLNGSDIDLIVLATTTPDHTFPATAVMVQAAIGMHHGAAFDVQAVCSGFIFALATANNFIKIGQAKRVLVIGSETLSRIVDWQDRSTCVLFGDGAGAVILEAVDDNSSAILSTHLHSDGRYLAQLYTNGGPSLNGQAGHIVMNGKEVFRHAVENLAAVAKEALEFNKINADAVKFVVPHQANIRIIQGTAQKLGIPMDRVVTTVAEHGNTSAASIPLALHSLIASGRVQRGDVLLLEAMGGGFTWGSALLRW